MNIFGKSSLHAALPKQRVRARLAGVRFQQAIHAKAFAHRAKQRQQGCGEGADQQQPIAALRLTDARRRQAHAEAQVLGIAELRLNRPPSGIVVDQRRRRRVPLAGRQAPGLLHIFRLHADDGADLLTPRGHPRVKKLAGTPTLAHPFRGGLGDADRVGDVDVAAEPDHVAEAQFARKGEQLLIAEAAIGEDGDVAAGGHEFGQPPQARILSMVTNHLTARMMEKEREQVALNAILRLKFDIATDCFSLSRCSTAIALGLPASDICPSSAMQTADHPPKSVMAQPEHLIRATACESQAWLLRRAAAWINANDPGQRTARRCPSRSDSAQISISR